jgi:hypothetical protein
VPFRNSLSGDWELGYSVLFEKTFWYSAALWLWMRAGSSATGAAVLTAGLLAAIEIAQIWLPARSAEITDPLLAIALAAMLRSIARPDGPRRGQPARAQRPLGPQRTS